MCIICYYPPSVDPSEPENLARLKEGCVANPHGYGWAVVSNSGDEILMGHDMDAAAAVAEFLKVRAVHTRNAAMFHARITTAGSTSLDNCHPFWVGGKRLTAVAHNGWLPCDPKAGDKRSDTRIFAEEIAAKKFSHLDSNKTRKRLESWMGRHSKMVFLTINPAYESQAYIFNAEAGMWEDGVWYSNDSFKPYWASSKRSGSYRSWEEEDAEYERWWERNGEAVGGRSMDRVTELVFLHDGCGQDSDHCWCGAGSRVFKCVDVASSTLPQHVRCESCGHFGTIDEENMCEWCQVCQGCRADADLCHCVGRKSGVDELFEILDKLDPKVADEITSSVAVGERGWLTSAIRAAKDAAAAVSPSIRALTAGKDSGDV